MFNNIDRSKFSKTEDSQSFQTLRPSFKRIASPIHAATKVYESPRKFPSQARH